MLDLIGLLGVALYVCAYAALQWGKLHGNSVWYSVLNGVAAALVLISLWGSFNLASALIQIMWISISISGIVRTLGKRRHTIKC